MDVNQAVVKLLENSGKVGHVFGSTGQVNASMLLSLRNSKTIETVIVRNEQAASFMACGYTMFNPDNLGVCFATGGPGAFNLFQGLAVAYYDSLPVLAITGYTSKAQRGKGALNESSGMNRTPDSQKMFSAETKKSFIVEDANEICNIMEEALTLAFDGRPGPVHIHIPKNITIAEVTNFRDIHPVYKKYQAKPETISAVADFLSKKLADNKNVVVLVGYGCIRSDCKEELINLIETYQIPFLSTMDAKGYLPENHALSAGVFGTSGDLLAMEQFRMADTVIALGNSFAENATFAFDESLYDAKTLIHINIDKAEIGKVYEATYPVCADCKLALKAILADMGKMGKAKALVKPALDKGKKLINSPLSQVKHSGKIHPADVAKTICKVAPENAIILGDAGSHMLWLSSYMSLDKNQRYQNPGSFGPMASHTNGAIGVKCANPDKVVISGSGDGCYLMAGFELITAVVYHIPVVWVIFNNGEFNVIKKFLLNMFGEYAYMDVPNPDYLKYAEACGAKAFRVEDVKNLEGVLEQAIALQEPVIIDVVIDNEVYPPMSISKN